MTRSKRMQPVKRIADERSRAAAKFYAEARQRLDEQRARLTQLESFRQEYLDQRTASGQGGIDAFRLRDYNAFISRIDTAVQQQREAVVKAESAVEQARSRWREAHGRHRAIGKVVEKIEHEERQAQERKLQKQADEHAQRRQRVETDD